MPQKLATPETVTRCTWTAASRNDMHYVVLNLPRTEANEHPCGCCPPWAQSPDGRSVPQANSWQDSCHLSFQNSSPDCLSPAAALCLSSPTRAQRGGGQGCRLPRRRHPGDLAQGSAELGKLRRRAPLLRLGAARGVHSRGAVREVREEPWGLYRGREREGGLWRGGLGHLGERGAAGGEHCPQEGDDFVAWGRAGGTCTHAAIVSVHRMGARMSRAWL